MKRSLLIAISMLGLAALGALALFAQQPNRSAPKQRELDRLRATIRESQGRLRALEGEARRSADTMAAYRRRTAALDTLIDALQAEEGKLAAEMIELRRGGDSLRGRLAALRGDYRRMTRSLLKQRLLTAGSALMLMPAEHQKLELRERLFERYVRRQREQAGRIATLSGTLAAQDSLLGLREREQMAVIAEKRVEIERLLGLQSGRAASLERTEAERAALQELIDRKNREARAIAGMIESLAVRDEPSAADARSARSQNGRDGAKGGAGKRSAPSKSRGAADRKNTRPSAPPSFKWPTQGRRIVEGYGERSNPETGTVTINPGINIGASAGSAVRASEGGTVSLVSWLPSYGTIVIVEHRGGYRTVYGNLAGATISRGASVGAGERIGTVGEAPGGSFLHFEVWKGQTRLNPMTVLGRK